ncbi:hypothetical protein FB45DRAFT_234499 [Roridomyces roridus]|uniref:BHLH domain-containing protein n=1 Tax=Roridomyces roridus TaxID=1738132 RepID=A0AAD7BBA9_9AGAR|nr:hypothetical protein FB45DRAFT_234499 [Roridomyces roridus]
MASPTSTIVTKTEPTPASPTPDPASSPTSEKRRAPRRASTAERRATHNAVERMRRETLNGRFLTLASLLPPLAALRRPSKAAIVGSSIATLHAARRHRVLAAQTLRNVTQEAETLRREINTWRARASIPPLETPIRPEAHAAVLRGEIEEIDVEVLLEEAGDVEEGDEDEGGVSPETPADRFAFAPEFDMRIPPPPMGMPMPGPRTPSSPSSASSGSWEGSRTPPSSAGMSMPIPMQGGVEAVLKQQMYMQQQQMYDARHKMAQIARAQAQMAASVQQQQQMQIQHGHGAGYDLGLGLGFDEEQGMGDGWANANPQHPAFYSQQQHGHGQGYFDPVYGGQGHYMHQSSAHFT